MRRTVRCESAPEDLSAWHGGLRQLEEELREAEEEGDKAAQAQLHMQLGDANDKLEHLSLQHYQSALQLFQDLGDQKGVEECHWKISLIQIAQVPPPSSSVCLLRCGGLGCSRRVNAARANAVLVCVGVGVGAGVGVDASVT